MSVESQNNSVAEFPIVTKMTLLAAAFIATGCVLTLSGCGSGRGLPVGPGQPKSTPLQHILFVGDSFTHGRYTPVRLYNSGGVQDSTAGSDLVFDENFGQTGVREESKEESGPWGGIPGIFAEFAVESGLKYDVHIEAISETSLHKNYAAASAVIDQSKWNAVVLQELSVLPLPSALSQSSISDPGEFCSAVQTIEQGVHAAAPIANVYLYETWPPADIAEANSGSTSSAGFSAAYTQSLLNTAVDYHNAYYSAAAHDGQIAAVAPAGEAWVRAWAEEIANPNPFTSASNLPVLWYGMNPVNDPRISGPDYHHPSIYGAYLSGLVLFEQITGTDVRKLGANEVAAIHVGIPADIAVRLQNVAWETVTQENPSPIEQNVDPCTLSH